MTETTRARLQRSLIERYRQLKDRLARKLGSASLADDALHETWIRLGRGGELEPVQNPEAYVYRSALNTAFQLRAGEARPSDEINLAELPDVADEGPSPDRIAQGHSDVAVVMKALEELTPRQREAFMASFMGMIPPDEIARRHGVSVRTIQADIRTAVIHCARRLGRENILAPGRVRLSRK